MIVEKRRSSDYKETLSSRMLFAACVTAMFVLLDPKVIVPLGSEGQMLTLGGAGFSLDIKGMVIGAIIIEGLKSIKEYWLGTSAGGQKQAESMSRIAEAAPALAAATPGGPLPTVKTENMTVESQTTNVTTGDKP